MNFREQWGALDERCPACSQITKLQPGLTRQHFRQMFSLKAFKVDVGRTILLLCILLLVFGYIRDTMVCRDAIRKMQESPYEFCDTLLNPVGNLINPLNQTYLNQTLISPQQANLTYPEGNQNGQR
jgi:hypothetical protein